MEDFLKRTWEHLLGRIGGPFSFRLILQPLVAAIIGLRAAAKDARAQRPPFGWSLFTVHENRRALLKEGWKETSRVFIVAVILDVIYQIIVLHWIYPGQLLLVASLLALLPYALVRGSANRIIKLWLSNKSRRMQRRQLQHRT